MKETKFQKIERLDRQKKELETYIKELKRSHHEEIRKYKDIIKSFEKIEKEYESKINKLILDNKCLKKKNNDTKKSYDSLKSNYIKLQMEFNSRICEKYESRETYTIIKEMEQEDKEWNKRRLKEFKEGWWSTNKGSLDFFNKDLIITINPKRGFELGEKDIKWIKDYIKDKPLYKELLKNISSITDELEKMEKTYEYGMKLYKELYSETFI